MPLRVGTNKIYTLFSCFVSKGPGPRRAEKARASGVGGLLGVAPTPGRRSCVAGGGVLDFRPEFEHVERQPGCLLSVCSNYLCLPEKESELQHPALGWGGARPRLRGVGEGAISHRPESAACARGFETDTCSALTPCRTMPLIHREIEKLFSVGSGPKLWLRFLCPDDV